MVFKRETVIRGSFLYIPSESGTGAEEERRGRRKGGGDQVWEETGIE